MARKNNKKEKKGGSGRSWKVTLLLFLLLIIGSAAVLFTLDGRHVQFRLVDSSEITVPYGVDYVEPGRSAITTGRIFGPALLLPVESSGYVNTKVIGTYELTYTTEFLFNTYTAKRIVHVADTTPPVLTLQTVDGYQPDWFTGYEEEGFLAWDDCDGDLTALVEREPLGDRIEYRVRDKAGNETVAERMLPEVIQPEEKTIYLTFDDGPGPYTEALLDLLAAYDVKVTFFVTCEYPKYEDMVGRAYREGHSIGVHSASHNYYLIYASEQNFLDDFYETEEMIYRQTGEYSQIFRFPGGSSNTVSYFNPGIISRLTTLMNNLGYQYYDWHVDSGDAGGTTSTAGVVANVTNGCAERRTSLVLQHDVKDYSVEAVEQIIIWGRQNGYTFRALDLTSPTAHHRIAN